MASLNSTHLIGNLTRPPETKYLPSGTAVCEFSLAINRVFTTGDGEKREEVDYIDCVAFARKAEIIQEYVGKGDPLFVSGRLKQEVWDDKQTGQKRSKIRVVVEDVQLLGRKRESDPSEPAERPSGRAQRANYGTPDPRAKTLHKAPRPPADPDLDTDGDTIPF